VIDHADVVHKWRFLSARLRFACYDVKLAVGVGRQSTGPIAAFLRPLPPAQSEADAKSMAASLAAGAAADAKQQEHAVHAMVQVCLQPDPDVEEGKAMAELQQPFLSCPVTMQVGELQKVSSCTYSLAVLDVY